MEHDFQHQQDDLQPESQDTDAKAPLSTRIWMLLQNAGKMVSSLWQDRQAVLDHINGNEEFMRLVGGQFSDERILFSQENKLGEGMRAIAYDDPSKIGVYYKVAKQGESILDSIQIANEHLINEVIVLEKIKRNNVQSDLYRALSWGVNNDGALWVKYYGLIGKTLGCDDWNSLCHYDKISLMIRLVMQLSVVHKSGLVHADIKPENIIYNHDGMEELELIDFGLTKEIGQPKEGGTFHYEAPDSFCTEALDVFSLGVLLVNIFIGMHTHVLIRHTRMLDYLRDMQQQDRVDPEITASGLTELMASMLAQDAEERPQLDEVSTGLLQASRYFIDDIPLTGKMDPKGD